MCFGLLSVTMVVAGDHYKTVKVKAPFPMQPIKIFIYPEQDFKITDFGAVPGGEVNNTQAIAAAIDACNKAGGGRVVVPAGTWLTGPVHFKSNVNLCLEENAVLSFTDNPEDYLPAVIHLCCMHSNVKMWQSVVKERCSRRWEHGKYGLNALHLIWKH